MRGAELSEGGYLAVRKDESGRTQKTLARCPVCGQLLGGAKLVPDDEIPTGEADLEQPSAHLANKHQPEDFGLGKRLDAHQSTLFGVGGGTA